MNNESTSYSLFLTDALSDETGKRGSRRPRQQPLWGTMLTTARESTPPAPRSHGGPGASGGLSGLEKTLVAPLLRTSRSAGGAVVPQGAEPSPGHCSELTACPVSVPQPPVPLPTRNQHGVCSFVSLTLRTWPLMLGRIAAHTASSVCGAHGPGAWAWRPSCRQPSCAQASPPGRPRRAPPPPPALTPLRLAPPPSSLSSDNPSSSDTQSCLC